MFKKSVRYFGAVVEHGSVRAAAEALHIAQSAVSRQLQALEHDLGVPLFERRPRGIVLTAAGEILHRSVREATFHIERLRSEIDALQGLRRGHVRLATAESFINTFVPRAIDRFRTKHPGVNFEVAVAGSDGVVQAVKTGDVDLGICFNQPAAPEVAVVLRHQEPICAMVAPSHPLARLRQMSIADLTGIPVGLSPRWSGTRQLVDAVCAKSGVTLTIALESNSIDLLHRFALIGQGVAFLIRSACMESLQAGRLVAIPVTDPSFRLATVEVVALANRRLPLAAEEFLGEIRAAFAEPQQQPPAVVNGKAPKPRREAVANGRTATAVTARR